MSPEDRVSILMPTWWDAIFPFYIHFSRDLRILHVGKSLKKIIPEVTEGANLGDLFALLSPERSLSLALIDLAELTNVLTLLKHTQSELRLRGQILRLSEAELLFVGSPWLLDMAEVHKLKLRLGDFSISDPTVDLLFAKELQHVALQESRHLSKLLENEAIALKESEKHLRQVIECSPSGILMIRNDGIIALVNAQVEKLFGYDQSEMLGHSVSMLIPQRFQEAYGSRIDQFFAHPIAQSMGAGRDLFGLRKDGTEFPLEIGLNPVDMPSGTQVLASINDITLRRQAEEKLRESQEQLRSVIESLPSQVWTSMSTGELDYVSQSTIEYFGVDSDTLLGQGWQAMIHPEDLPACVERWTNSCRTGEPYEAEFRLRRADGNYRWHLGRALPIRDNCGDIIKWFGTSTDITGQKEELMLQQRLATIAESSSRIKSEFVAVMSHEFRTPMNSILGMAEVLSKTKLTDTQQRYLSVLSESATGLLGLLNDILDLSKIESGKLDYEVASVNVGELIHKTAALFQSQARHKNVSLTVEIAADMPARCLSDGTRLRQILLNLIGNAVKFTNRGSVTVRASTTALEADSVRLVIEISDTGIGIPADQLERIYEPFVQVDSSSARKFQGTGLGLAVCKRLLDLLNGEIVVSSVPDEGSVFRVIIPVKVACQTPVLPDDSVQEYTGPTPENIARLASARILLVEDQAENRFVFKAYLDSMVPHLDIAESGPQAIELFTAGTYDAVLMDIQMPGMDGYTAAKALRAWEQLKGAVPTPIAALSAYAFEAEVQKSLNSGFVMHLTKPISQRDLLEGIIGLISPGPDGVAQGHSSPPPAMKRNDFQLPDEFVVGYLSRRFEDLAACQAAVDAGDFDIVRSFMHKMAGSGGLYGFPLLSTEARAIERVSTQRNAEEVRKGLRSIEQMLRALTKHSHD